MESLFLNSVRDRALRGDLPRREDILRLLAVTPDSSQAQALGEAARDMARVVAKNTATVWAAIGVDSLPCPMNCAFCAFGEKWGVMNGRHEWSAAEVARAARQFAEAGAAWIVLRTTESYGQDRLCALARTVRETVPEDRALVANTAQLNVREIDELQSAGIDAAYHALRLREGIDTPFDPAERRAALERLCGTGLKLAHLVEPVGVEHSDGEIADALLAALDAGAEVCGVMGRSNVPGTPFEGRPSLPEKRLAQIAAVTRLCGGARTPHICVHPPVRKAVEWGANVLVVETGAVPRDDAVIAGDWHGFSVRDAQDMFRQCGYAVKEGAR